MPYRGGIVPVTIDRLTPAIGALVHLDDRTVSDPCLAETLYAALIDHQVLVLRDFSRSVNDLVALAEAFGPVTNDHHEYQSHPESRDVVVLEWGGDRRPDAAEWHADMTYRASPPFASVLQAVHLPPTGGDTLWASMYSAFEALPAGLQDELASLDAVHDMGAFRTSAYRAGGLQAMSDALVAAGSAVHPIVAHHPVTGRPYLNVSESFTRFVIGLSAPESARLLTMLFDQINRPEHHVRLRWEPGTVAIWDNRATQHYAVADYLPNRRVMHRVAVTTDVRAATFSESGELMTQTS